MQLTKMAALRATRSCAVLIVLFGFSGSCSPGEEHDSHRESEPDEEDHVEGRVELSEQQFASAEIEVSPAGPQQIVEHLTLPAVVSMNADASTHVNPKVPGLVRSIHKRLGEHVEAGDLLCSIDSVELGGTVADLVLAKALVRAAEETLAKERTLFEQRLKTTEEVLSGAIEVNESIYEREKKLQEKAVSTIRHLLEAEKSLKNSKLARAQRLSDLEAERDARMLSLAMQVREKQILVDGARNRLLALGIEEESLFGLDSGSALLAGTYDIHATRPGIVAERHISTGEYVDAETRLFTIEDLSRVWVIASAFEQQVQSVRTGQEAMVVLNSFPGMNFPAKVSVVGFRADPESRAIGVRVELDNPKIPHWPEEYPIRPGMFGSVKLVTGRRDARIVVPESAIVHDDHGESVFVQSSERVFDRRSVTVLPTSGEVVEVLTGLEPGEQVVVIGTFLLKSIAGQEELGGGHSH